MNAIKSIRAEGSRPAPGLQRQMSSKVAISTSEGIHLVSWHEIVRCAADSNYTQVFLSDGTSLLVSKTLARIEAILPSRQFVRIHQSHLVNIGSIRCAGKDSVRLQCGSIIPVSRHNRSKLMDAINGISYKV